MDLVRSLFGEVAEMFTLTPTGKVVYFEQEASPLPHAGHRGGSALGPTIVTPQIEGMIVTEYGPGVIDLGTSLPGEFGTAAMLLSIGAGNVSVVTLANDLRTQYEAHRVDLVAHSGADAANVVTAPLATDLPSAITLLNDIKAQYEAHRIVSPAVHAAADGVNVVTAANATDLASAITLANDVKAQYEAHRIVTPAVHIASDVVNVVTAPNATTTIRSVMLLDGDPAWPLGSIELFLDTFNRLYVTIKDRAGVTVGETIPTGAPVTGGSSYVELSWNATAPIDGVRYAYLRVNGVSVPVGAWTGGTDPVAAWNWFRPSQLTLGSDVAEFKLSRLSL